MIRRCRAVVPQAKGTRPRWAELRAAAERELNRLATESGYKLVGQVRYVTRVELSAFGAIDPETLLVDKYIFEADAEEVEQ